MRVLRAACLLCAMVLQLAACGRTDDGAARAGAVFLAAPISNPWTASTFTANPGTPPDDPPSLHTAPSSSAPLALDSPHPDTRLAAMEAWTRFRPDSLHEIGPMLHDPDPSVRTRARELWTTALSGGRKADPE